MRSPETCLGDYILKMIGGMRRRKTRDWLTVDLQHFTLRITRLIYFE